MRRMHFDADDTSPAARRALLARPWTQMPRSGKTFLERLVAQEELVDARDEDVVRARSLIWQIKAAGGLFPEEAAGRYLDPLARRRYVDMMQAVEGWEEAVKASERARAQLYRMQAQFNAAHEPLPDMRDYLADDQGIGMCQ